jgi:hypothetical protein
MRPEGDWAAEPGTDSPARLRFKLVHANFDGASSATLRFDQMLDARFWRIGFTFEMLGRSFGVRPAGLRVTFLVSTETRIKNRS